MLLVNNLTVLKEKLLKFFFSAKPEKPLIDLPSQREKIGLKTSQVKTLDIVEKILSDLKVKTEGTSTSAARTISRNEKEPTFESDSESLSFVFARNNFDDGLPEIKRFVGKTNPINFTKNWYSKPTPPNMQFEERSFQTQFSVSTNKFYEWNILWFF